MWTSRGLNGLSLPCRRGRYLSPSKSQFLHDGCSQHKEIVRAAHEPRVPSSYADRAVAPTITECNDGTMQMQLKIKHMFLRITEYTDRMAGAFTQKHARDNARLFEVEKRHALLG
jgi:hypothetical protein